MLAALIIVSAIAFVLGLLFVVAVLDHRDLFNEHTALLRKHNELTELLHEYADEWDAYTQTAIDLTRAAPNDDLAVEAFRRALDTLDETQDYR